MAAGATARQKYGVAYRAAKQWEREARAAVPADVLVSRKGTVVILAAGDRRATVSFSWSNASNGESFGLPTVNGRFPGWGVDVIQAAAASLVA